MTIPQQLAKHFKEVHLGGNWTGVALTTAVEGLSWEQATTKVHSFNTIAVLVYHINYYVRAVLNVLEGAELAASDKFSFDMPAINTAAQWEALLQCTWDDIEKFAALVAAMPESKLAEDFSGGKYGNYFRNILGVIEHTHYHLGQIIILKKLIATAT